MLIAGEGNPLRALFGTDGFVTMSLKDIPQELHVERIVLDDQDPLGCRSRARKGFYQFENSRALQQGIGWYRAGGIRVEALGAKFVTKLLKCSRFRTYPG